jgi:A/G-specific adenine glycosylase
MTLAASPAGKSKIAASHTTAGRGVRTDRRGGGPVPDSRRLLAWYDRNRRDLPWRVRPGATPHPYRVWLSEIMLQQTRVETVIAYYRRFLDRFPNVRALAAARRDTVLSQWAGLGYYARARNLHACARTIVARHAGKIPKTEVELRALPGIGAYSAAAIAAIAFGQRAAAVDGNVERVIARLYAVDEALPKARPELVRRARALVPAGRPGDFAQAMIELGATVCTPRRPDCAACPWRGSCEAARLGNPEEFPRRIAKRNGRLRRGAAFVAIRADGAVLLRRRPPRGLLGGMMEVPGTEWASRLDSKDLARHAPALSAAWRRLPGTVTHAFTHFPLRISVYMAAIPKRTRAPAGMRFVPLARLDREALPTLMRKIVARACAADD